MGKMVEYDLIDRYKCGRCNAIVLRNQQKISIMVTEDDTPRTRIQKVMQKLINNYKDSGSFEFIDNLLLPTFLHECNDGIHYTCVLDSIEVFDEKDVAKLE